MHKAQVTIHDANKNKASVTMSLLTSFLSGAGIGCVVGTLILPGIGSIVGSVLGGITGYNVGLIVHTYGRLICCPDQKKPVKNKISGTIGTMTAFSVLGAIIGTLIAPGVGSILGSIIGTICGSILSSIGLVTSFIVKKTIGKNREIDNIKSNGIDNTRSTLTRLGIYSGIGTVIGWVIGTFVLPGIGTSLGGVLGGFIGASIGFSAISAKYLITKTNRQYMMLGLFNLSIIPIITTVLGALIGTFLFPGVGTGIGSLIGTGIGGTLVCIGALSNGPVWLAEICFKVIKYRITKRDNNIASEVDDSTLNCSSHEVIKKQINSTQTISSCKNNRQSKFIRIPTDVENTKSSNSNARLHFFAKADKTERTKNIPNQTYNR